MPGAVAPWWGPANCRWAAWGQRRRLRSAAAGATRSASAGASPWHTPHVRWRTSPATGGRAGWRWPASPVSAAGPVPLERGAAVRSASGSGTACRASADRGAPAWRCSPGHHRQVPEDLLQRLPLDQGEPGVGVVEGRDELTQRPGPVLRSDQHAVALGWEVDPVPAPLPLASDAVFLVDSEARGAVNDGSCKTNLT